MTLQGYLGVTSGTDSTPGGDGGDSGLVLNPNGTIDSQAYNSFGQPNPLAAALQYALNPQSANPTTLQGGVSNSPPLSSGTTQNQSGTPGTQNQSIQVQLPQQAPASASGPGVPNPPQMNPLTFNNQAPTTPAPLQGYAGQQNQFANLHPQAPQVSPGMPNMAPPGFSNQATRAPNQTGQPEGQSPGGGQRGAGLFNDPGAPRGSAPQQQAAQAQSGGSGWIPEGAPEGGQGIAPTWDNSTPPGELTEAQVNAVPVPLQTNMDELNRQIRYYQQLTGLGSPADQALQKIEERKAARIQQSKTGGTGQKFLNLLADPEKEAERIASGERYGLKLKPPDEREYLEQQATLKNLFKQRQDLRAKVADDHIKRSEQRRGEMRMNPGDYKTVNEMMSGLDPRDPKQAAIKTQLIEAQAMLGTIPNTPESKNNWFNRFDPEKKVKDDLELQALKDRNTATTYRMAMLKDAEDGKKEMADAKLKAEKLDLLLKEQDLKIKTAKATNAPIAQRMALERQKQSIEMHKQAHDDRMDALAFAKLKAADSGLQRQVGFGYGLNFKAGAAQSPEASESTADYEGMRQAAIEMANRHRQPSGEGQTAEAKPASVAPANVPPNAWSDYFTKYKRSPEARASFIKHFKIDPEAMAGG